MLSYFFVECLMAQNQIAVRRLERPKTASHVRVYATMLVQVTPDNTEIIPTTTIDNNDDSDKEEAQSTGEANEERFTQRPNKSKSLTEKTGVDQSLIDDFIFTTKAIKVTKKSEASGQFNTAAMLTALCLLSFLFI